MNFKKILCAGAFVICTALFNNVAMAAGLGYCATGGSSTVSRSKIYTATNCATENEVCFYNTYDGVSVWCYSECTSCKQNSTKTTMPLDLQSYCGNGASVDIGVCECGSCSNCTSDTSWSSAGAGYEKIMTRSCDCGTCTEWASYRCAAGYYGTPNVSGTSGCTRCPSSGGIYGVSPADSKSVTDCCLPAGSAFGNDGTGSGKYSDDCCFDD